MIPVWDRPVADPALAARLAALVPPIVTERLVLRLPRLSDWPALRPIWESDRAVHIGGPFDPDTAWRDFCPFVASWLLNGYGARTVERRADGAVLGLMTLGVEQDDPDPEFGWLFLAEAEGQGYASEAARAMLPEALCLFGPGGVVSCIDPQNLRSIAIARKLGARRDPAAEAEVEALGEGPMQVWRHPGEAA